MKKHENNNTTTNESRHLESFKLPDNWVYTSIKSLVKEMRSKKPNDLNLEYFKYIDIDAVDNKAHSIRLYKNLETADAPSRASREIRKDDVIFSLVRPYLENIAYVVDDFDDIIASTGFYVLRSNGSCIPRYIYYYLLSDSFINNTMSYMKGDNSPSIRKSEFESLLVALPPIQEQQRIVNRIESLFEKIDKAQELIEEAREGFEKRKEAILAKAFRGELTAKWREENGVKLDSWNHVQLDEVCLKITDGTHQTPQYSEQGFKFLSAKNIKNGRIDWDNIKFIPQELHEKLYGRLAPTRGDVLLSKNGSTGKAAIVDVDEVFDIYVSLALLRPSEKIVPEYLLLVVNSPMCYAQFCKHLTGIGVPNLHLRDIRKTMIQLPSTEEQKAIVSILKALLNEEEYIADLTNQGSNMELLKKSVLAKAFRGELGTNDPTEESAINLLNEILANKSKK
ncbi:MULTISPECIES: restriction endonuclease subunit S [unclassified Fusibacter]|uniref:restriction endonuclease subunit S n=1 Tax=unclassified Fusibacter TaxID=2624464 RepID=UPI0010126C81|nr:MULTISPECIES: restriction endonuclease subunit S [unclassified Fusibacter]MCK8059722.1 restriction endonuclease subunit S [Fusibacter sp. A2]NPE21523.1 hypothetical protein [Fusibacter sp. A1]